MSKKSNKKSSKKKVSKKKHAKKPTAKKAGKKSSKKGPAPKKKPTVKKAKTKKIIKKAVKKVVAKKTKKVTKPVKETVIKPVVKVKPVAIAKAPVNTKPAKAEVAPAEKTVPVKEAKPAKKTKPTAPRNLIPVVPKKSVAVDIKLGPEPKGRFELEYVFHSSAPILYEFLTSPSGLSEWFCDDVNIRNGIYSFKWDENEQNARVVKLIEEKLVRFQWVDKTDNSYFEFRIERDDLTNDISLLVVDFAETQEDRNSSTLLWNSQIDKLMHVLGSYF